MDVFVAFLSFRNVHKTDSVLSGLKTLLASYGWALFLLCLKDFRTLTVGELVGKGCGCAVFPHTGRQMHSRVT